MELFLDALDAVEGPDGRVAGADEAVAAALATVRDADRPVEERVGAAVGAVQRLAQGRAGLVVFEDLHWADPESLSVFERLAAPDGGRLLLVGTYRPDGLSRRHPASEMLPRLERRHAVTHVRLARLEPVEVGAFLDAVEGRSPSFRVVDALHTRTGGNPFFLEALVAAGGGSVAEGDTVPPLPWTVTEVVRAQVDELAPEVRRIVTAASVLGRRVAFDVLAAVTKTSEDELIDLLRAAVDGGLLVELDTDVFGFHHELAREAIESGLLGRERRRLHEAALEALRATGSSDHVALARHAQGAGDYDAMVAEARLGAHESLARGSSYQAVELAELGLTEAEDDLDLLALAARGAWLAGLEDALEHAERWLRLARRTGDMDLEAEALALTMRAAYEAGDLARMTTYSDELGAVVDRLPSEEGRARAMAALAQSYMLRDLAGPACEWADKALDLAETHDLPAVRVAAKVEKGSVLLMQLHGADEGHALLEEAAAEGEAIGEHLLAARALNNLMWHIRRWRDLDAVRTLVMRVRDNAEAAGFDALTATSRAEALAQMAAVDGDLDSAICLLDDGIEKVGRMHRKGGWGYVFRAGLALEAGDLDAAAAAADRAKPPTDRSRLSVAGLDLHIACRRGDLPAARRHLATVLAEVAREGFASPPMVHDLLAGGFPAGLTPDELRPLVAQANFHVDQPLAAEHPWRRLLEAQLAEAEGDREAAAAGYAAAAEGLGDAPDVLVAQRGTAHVGAARCLVALDRLADARRHAEAAAPFLARWGGWRVAELEAVQRRLGLGPATTGPAALTPREREVAALLAEGLTNSQLAERLFISPRTAAVHVSNILAKLGMSSRTEVAAWAVRADLAH
jgi:DNA-binding CsgD family transcriptional regulator